MISSRLPLSRRLSSGLPLQSPNRMNQMPGLRLFTQKSLLLLISPATPRPQLPFLHASSLMRPPTSFAQRQFQLPLSRLLTTERKLYLKDELRKAGKYILYSGTMLLLLFISLWGYLQEQLERSHPSPPVWTLWSRVTYRDAWSIEDLGTNGTAVIDWFTSGRIFRVLLARLEDPSIDGADLRPVFEEGGDIYVRGVGKAGFDISFKPEAWRRGYYATIMGCARAAEHLDGWVQDTTRGLAFPPDVVIGSSNPRPKPVRFNTPAAPLEENCAPAFDKPETYYMKILTTRGFTTRQRLDAALACADYLDFKGLHSSAEEMCHWGLDIAMGALPFGVDNLADTKSGILSADAKRISSNLLLATTSLAMHHARNKNLATALPIFLSILRARRQLPSASISTQTTPKAPTRGTNASTFGSLVSSAMSLIKPPDYPPPPPTGDEVPSCIPVEICEEAAVMAYVGEILFASASLGSAPKGLSRNQSGSLFLSSANDSQLQNQQSGLSWTRDAVELAEEILLSAERNDLETRKKCSECLEVGMGNWSKMVNKLLKEERGNASPSEQKRSNSGNWFWGGSNAAVEEGEGKWQQEARLVEEKKKSVSRLLREEQSRKEAAGSTSGIFFI